MIFIFRNRVVTSILCVSLFFSSSPLAYAATSDDLRAFLGKPRITDEEFELEVAQIIKAYPDAEESVLAEIQSYFSNSELDLRLEKAQQDFEETSKVLTESFASGVGVSSINFLVSECMQHQDAISSLDDTSVVEFTMGKSSKSAYEYAVSMLRSKINVFDLGSLGSDLRCILEGYPALEKPFGSVTSASGKKSSNYYVTIRSNGKSKVYAQFNGIVTSLRQNKETKEILLVLQCGNFVECWYRGLTNVTVREGQRVMQNMVIGSTDKPLDYQIKLNTRPVNPVLLWGTVGSRIMADFKVLNPGVVIDYDGSSDTVSEEVFYAGFTGGSTLGIPSNKPQPGLDTGTYSDSFEEANSVSSSAIK